MAIGRWPEWTVTAARERAKELRRVIEEGGDPLGARGELREAPRFSDMIERYLAEHVPHLAKTNASDQHSMLIKLVAQGSLPKPRKLSAGRSAWLVEELEAWGKSLPVSDLLPPPGCGHGRAGKAALINWVMVLPHQGERRHDWWRGCNGAAAPPVPLAGRQ